MYAADQNKAQAGPKSISLMTQTAPPSTAEKSSALQLAKDVFAGTCGEAPPAPRLGRVRALVGWPPGALAAARCPGCALAADPADAAPARPHRWHLGDSGGPPV
jgi:hypothetical protein